MKTAIILGSSRSNGNTAKLSQHFAKHLDATVFDINNLDIAPFDYDANYQDDFKPLIDRLLNFERIILATPMYWYAASAQMKTFLDRLSDLLNSEKHKGRKLRGKSAVLLATGADSSPPPCFEEMFKLTFNYLGMHYQGMRYCACPADINLLEHQNDNNDFMNKITII